MAKPLKDMYRRQLVKACLTRLPLQLKNISVFRTAEILAALGHENEVFWWLGTHDGVRHPWTAKKLKHKVLSHSNVATWSAFEINIIEFFGGPPDRFKIHTGSLLTLVFDRILLNIERVGLETFSKILKPGEIYA